jgi:hypothetical protein
MFQSHTTAQAIADSYRKRSGWGTRFQSNTTVQAIADSYRKLTR